MGDDMRYEKPKGQRLHKQFWAITSFGPQKWWSSKHDKWLDEIPDNHTGLSTHKRCRSLRAFRRHLRKHPELVGDIILVSRFVGYNISVTRPVTGNR